MKILTLFGTRPEAIKMAPLVAALACEDDIDHVLCVTGQHREMLDQVMTLFGLRADHDLDVMTPGQTLNGLFARLMSGIDGVLATEQPDWVLVHGDTTTACAGAMAAFHRGIPVGHVEAGLRTGNMAQPFPEEMNRRYIDLVASHLFAPTPLSAENLECEQPDGLITVTGNTVIDALAMTCTRLAADTVRRAELAAAFGWLDPSKRLILVTGHRRESFAAGFQEICQALLALSRRDDVQIVYPVHLNPALRATVMSALGDVRNVHLIEPLDYEAFVWMMQQAYVILTDSGGVQEEAPYLGKPVLVMREMTERPEAVAAGTVRLVGTDTLRIVGEVVQLLDDPAYYEPFCRARNPYGDGRACARIVDALRGRDVEPFGMAYSAVSIASSLKTLAIRRA